MATKILFYTDTPQDTAFTDKLYNAASERVNLAGMYEGEFTVIDILPDDQVKVGQHIYGAMQYKFRFAEELETCLIYPARFLTPGDAEKACRYHGESESAFEDWSNSDAPRKARFDGVTIQVTTNQFYEHDEQFFSVFVFCETEEQQDAIMEMYGVTHQLYCDGKASEDDRINEFGKLENTMLDCVDFLGRYARWSNNDYRGNILDERYV